MRETQRGVAWDGQEYVVQSRHRYPRIERERRFLLNRVPPQADAVRVRHIMDHYIDGMRLRLRRQTDDDGSEIFKLTQKVPLPGSGARQGLLTTIYLNAEEFRIFAELPGRQLTKARYSVPPFGIDMFEGSLAGLVLAEVEFDSASEADSLVIPSFVASEVTEDVRFTGGRLVHASRQDVQDWVAEYGVELV